MNHRQIEADIRHLEAIFRDLTPNAVLPLRWWRQRVQALATSAQLSDHVRRVQLLEECLGAIEAAGDHRKQSGVGR